MSAAARDFVVQERDPIREAHRRLDFVESMSCQAQSMAVATFDRKLLIPVKEFVVSLSEGEELSPSCAVHCGRPLGSKSEIRCWVPTRFEVIAQRILTATRDLPKSLRELVDELISLPKSTAEEDVTLAVQGWNTESGIIIRWLCLRLIAAGLLVLVEDQRLPPQIKLQE